jgi:hypothetical protein
VELTGQWADTLRDYERLAFLKLIVWSAMTVLVGTALLASAGRSAASREVLGSFAMALLLIGALELSVALLLRSRVPMRDHVSATLLDRGLWCLVGAASMVAIGSFAGVVRSWSARSEPASGRSTGLHVAVLLHSLAVALLSLQLAAVVVR